MSHFKSLNPQVLASILKPQVLHFFSIPSSCFTNPKSIIFSMLQMTDQMKMNTIELEDERRLALTCKLIVLIKKKACSIERHSNKITFSGISCYHWRIFIIIIIFLAKRENYADSFFTCYLY